LLHRYAAGLLEPIFQAVLENAVREELMTRNTSAVAFSRSSASSRSRRRRADSLSARTAGALRRFGVALRLRALVGLLLALERRRIAYPKA
jgi:hypothetical protein